MNKFFRRTAFVLLALLLSFKYGNAQIAGPGSVKMAQSPVSWQFSIKKLDNGSYRFEAKAMLSQGFHIWAQDPGGDGSLIPTSFTAEQIQNGKWTGDWKETEAPKTEKIDVFGDAAVRWFEKTVTFYRDFNAPKGAKIKGAVQFQSCNDQMCFPPAIQNFMVTVE